MGGAGGRSIWQRSRKTIVFVTHGISEAVFLGTRAIVLTAGPARMADNIDIAAGKFALSRTKDSQVKNFASMMVRDHTGVNEKAAALAQKLGAPALARAQVSLPSEWRIL